MKDGYNFDSHETIEIPFLVKGKNYILREASGETAVVFRNAQIECTTMGPEGKPKKFEGVADVEPLLVSRCSWEQTTDGKEKPVSIATVKSWPSRVQKKLFNDAKRISELDESSLEDLIKERNEINDRIREMKEEKEAAKNE